MSRSRWAAVGAAVAVSIGAGSIGVVGATIDSGERPVLVQITPCRLLDTRDTAPIGAGETLTVPAHGINGDCNLPVEAVGLSLNVTAVQASEQTNVRVFPEADDVPLASNLNPSPGSPPVPNAVTTQLDAAGAFSIFNEFGTVGLVVDVNGFYEDHNHDDRYVLQGEFDAHGHDEYVDQAEFEAHGHDGEYVAQADIMWAAVTQTAAIARSSDGVVSADVLPALPNPGAYAVVFDRDISNCVYQATVGSPSAISGVGSGPQPGYAMVAAWDDNPTNGVLVFVRDQSGAPVNNRSFHLLVTC